MNKFIKYFALFAFVAVLFTAGFVVSGQQDTAEFGIGAATAYAWGGGDADGFGGEGGVYGGDGCGGCTDSPTEDDTAGDPPGAFILDCKDPEALNYNPGADGHDQAQCKYPAPTCDSFYATPSTIDKGETSLLKWRTSNATKVELTRQFGTQKVDEDGKQTVNPNSTFTFVLTVYGTDNQKDTCTAKVKVIEPKPTPAPTCDSFYATPSTIDKGETSLLKWRTSNATKVELERVTKTQTVAEDGSLEVNPNSTFTYKLIVYGVDGKKDTCTAKVKVIEPKPTPAPTCDSFTATPSTIDKGETSLLKWRTSNATKVELTRQFGTQEVSADDKQVVKPNNDFTFVLTVYGENQQTDTCAVKVKVKQPVNDVPSCDSFTATPSTIDKGESSLLEWTTTNAVKVKLERVFRTETVAEDGSLEVNPGSTFTFKLIVYGTDNQKDTCTTKVKVIEPKPILSPTCDFSATPVEINEGEKSLLKWTTTNATKVELTRPFGTQEVDANDKQKVKPGDSYTYKLVAYGENQQRATCYASVTVVKQNTPAPTCDSFYATPKIITKGDSSLLKWETSNATKVELVRPFGTQEVKVDGSQTVKPGDDYTFKLIVYGENQQTDTCTTKVTVTEKPVTPIPTCDSFTATPSTIKKGEYSLLKWETSNATKVELTRPFGTQEVSADSSVEVNPGDDYTFKLTVYGADQSTDVCTVKVVVDEEEEPETPLSCNIWTTDGSINRGDETTIKWESDGATTASLDEGIGSVSLNGSRNITPSSDTIYTLTVTDGDDTADCSVNINVKTPSSGGSSGSTPYCDIDVSDDDIRPGQAIVLEWRTWNTDEIILEDSDDNVLIESDDEDDLDSEITIRPNHDLTFYLTAIDGNDEEECEVKVNVSGSSVVSQTRNQLPLIAGISLSQVPYTGFEAGPMLTLIFYVVLAIWGLFVAYVVAVRKGLVRGVSFAGTGRILTSDVSKETPVATNYVAQAVETNPEVSFAPSNLPTGVPAPVVGYDAHVAQQMAETTIDTSLTDLENIAHGHKALFSSDAMRHFAHVVPEEKHNAELVNVIETAKSTFPNEDGWVVINLTRLEALMESEADEVTSNNPTVATSAGSLAEAIISGNIVAAYEMIAHRPMIALADAAAELDTLLRVRSGSQEIVSDLLQKESVNVSDEQLRSAIHALTSALDGTYTSEEDAVKMAIMKAVKAIA